MVVVGLTGGIGSGKSTVASLLAELGAVVVETDTIARDVVAPGGAAHDAVVERFGRSVVGPGGDIDRQALADIIFADDSARADLNAIVHPAIANEVDGEMSRRVGTDDVVVLVVPLLFEAGWDEKVDVVLVVDCPEEVARRRLVEGRGMDDADIERRMKAQMNRADRVRRSDVVVTNDGSLDDLRQQVASAWQRIAA